MNKNKEMTKRTIDFILVICDELKKEIEKEKLGNDIPEEIDKVYMTQTILSVIYKILINEGYTKKHLDNFFFFEGEPDKHKERTSKACTFYHANQKNSSMVIEEFFYEDPAGIKLRKEIDNLSENFN
ncbi:hypothetical protein ES705_37205 [subsurface metagenome]